MGRGEMHTGCWWKNLMKREHLEDSGVDGRIILKWILEKWDRDTDSIYLAQDRDRWQALVNAVMNLQIP
jgi:hypothetical protein